MKICISYTCTVEFYLKKIIVTLNSYQNAIIYHF